MSQSFIIISTRELTMDRIREVADGLSSDLALLSRRVTSDEFQIRYESTRSESFNLYTWSYPEAAVLEYLEFDGITPEATDVLFGEPKPQMYRVWFTDFSFANMFLLGLCESALRAGILFWIDNDYGSLLSSVAVLKAVTENPHADWRFPSLPR